MQIRPAEPRDVVSVLPMVQAMVDLHLTWDARRFDFLDDAPRRYESWLTACTSDAQAVFLVAEREGRLVGFLVATVERAIPIYKTKRYGFIHDLYVEPAYRNEGLGKQMTMLAIERFAQMGVTQIRLETAQSNETARAMYERLGFSRATVEMVYHVE